MGFDRIILGENAVYSTDCNETGLNNNVLVCGCSGSGKTMSIIEPRLLETFNSSLIVSVTKRRIVNKYKSMFEKRGYIVEDMNFTDPEKSTVTYDPLQYICSYSDIKYLSKSIVLANPRKVKSNADPYWDDESENLLSAEIAYTLMTKEKPTFADVLELHNSIDFNENDGQIKTSLDQKFHIFALKDPKCFAVTCWKSFIKLPIKTASCVYGTLSTALDTVFSPELRKMIVMEKKIDFEQLANKKTVLFISTSAVNSALHYFVNMFYAQAFKSLFEYSESLPDSKLPIPVCVLCDDFAVGCKIHNFPEYISIMREAQISVTLLVQDLSQLESIYGSNDATTIANNCDTQIYTGTNDLKTGRALSERLNVPLEDVLYMPVGREYVFRRGQKPIQTSRYDILHNKMYQNITKQHEKDICDKGR